MEHGKDAKMGDGNATVEADGADPSGDAKVEADGADLAGDSKKEEKHMDLVKRLIRAHFEGLDKKGNRKRLLNFLGAFLKGGQYHRPSKDQREQLAGKPTTNDLVESLFGLFDLTFRRKINANDLSINGVVLWMVNKVNEKIPGLLPEVVHLLVKLCISRLGLDKERYKEKLAEHARGRFLAGLALQKKEAVKEHERLVKHLRALSRAQLLQSSMALLAELAKRKNKTDQKQLLTEQKSLLEARGLPKADLPKFSVRRVKVPHEVVAQQLGLLLDAVTAGNITLHDGCFAWGTDWMFETDHGLPLLESTASAKLVQDDINENNKKKAAKALADAQQEKAKEKERKEEEKAMEKERKEEEKKREKERKEEEKKQEVQRKEAARQDKKEEARQDKQQKKEKKEKERREKAEKERREKKEKKEKEKKEKEKEKKEKEEEKKFEAAAKKLRKTMGLEGSAVLACWVQCADPDCLKWRLVTRRFFSGYTEHGCAFFCAHICRDGCDEACDGCEDGDSCDCAVATKKRALSLASVDSDRSIGMRSPLKKQQKR